MLSLRASQPHPGHMVCHCSPKWPVTAFVRITSTLTCSSRFLCEAWPSLKGVVWYVLMSKDLCGLERGSWELLAAVQVHSSCCAVLWPVPGPSSFICSVDATLEFTLQGGGIDSGVKLPRSILWLPHLLCHDWTVRKTKRKKGHWVLAVAPWLQLVTCGFIPPQCLGHSLPR